MRFNEKEIKLLKQLVKNELKEFEKEGDTIRPTIPMLEAEEIYEDFLKKLLKKIEGKD